MSLRSVVLIVVLALMALFVGVNWTVMTTPTDLSLIFTTVYAPVGVVMLCLMGLLALIFVVFMLCQQSAVLKETRLHSKEMAAQRELADKAEASRFTDLKQYLTDEIARMHEHVETTSQALQSRVDRLEIGLRETSPEGELKHLAELSERHAQDIQSRVDRLEIGLREMQQPSSQSAKAAVAAPAPVELPVVQPQPPVASTPAASAIDINTLRL